MGKVTLPTTGTPFLLKGLNLPERTWRCASLSTSEFPDDWAIRTLSIPPCLLTLSINTTLSVSPERARLAARSGKLKFGADAQLALLAVKLTGSLLAVAALASASARAAVSAACIAAFACAAF